MSAGEGERRWILAPGCRRSGEAPLPDAPSRRPRERLFWPHWSSTSPPPVVVVVVTGALGEAGSEKSGLWWWLPWSRAGLRVATVAAGDDEEAAVCAGGG